MIWQLIVIGMIGYLIGSVNLSIILSKLVGKGDIRNYGSGNAGTTNTLRTLGVLPAIAVLAFDIFKGCLAIIIAKGLVPLNISNDIILQIELAQLIAGFTAILGHNFPIYYGFKGGKGVASSLGVLIMIEPKIGLVCLFFGLILILASRMVSLGSIFAAFLYPILVFVVGDVFGTELRYKIPYFLFACILALLVIYRHRKNIDRLLNGTENRLWKTKKEKIAMEVAKASEATKEEK